MSHAIRALLCVGLLAFALPIYGANPGRVAGKVTDTKTREPLVGANVTVVGTNRGSTTDVEGDFSIANLEAGTYSLRVKVVGYKDVVVQDVRVRLDQTTTVNVRMEQTVLDIGQEIVTTAQRPLVEKDNTASRVYVEKQEIEARPVQQLGELVTALPSINDEYGTFKVRGGTLNEVSFLVDGARARNPLDQNPYTNINLGSIQEMEVITGSYNAEYGEARSGVFNIVTKEGGETYDLYVDGRYVPPGVKHWGPSLYDENTTIYWENTHARHQQWWIDYPDQWVDPNGRYGNDPACAWTPEQAYQNYLDTHRPLNDYAKTPGYSAELSFGGPLPFLSQTYFHLSGKYRVEAPLMGNSYRSKGTWFDGTAKLSYQFTQNMKLLLSGFWGLENTGWGASGGPDYFWAEVYGNTARYAYYDFPGYPTTRTWGGTVKFTNVPDPSSLYEIKFSAVTAIRKVEPFPDDPQGYAASGPVKDNLRAVETSVDTAGNLVTRFPEGGYENIIGYNTTGYFYRYDDQNSDLTLTGFYQRQVNKIWQLKTGAEFTYYILDHYNEAKSPTRVDDHTYNPYQGAAYFQNKLELGGFIMNIGLRYDLYNPNDVVYLNYFSPLTSATEKSQTFSQLSLRLGISHPIDEYTVLHFSYGHFFQRSTFGDYGEGTSDAESRGSLTTFVNLESGNPWVLGNRALKPEKTISYEVGIERNFFQEIVVGVTAFYKDIRNVVRALSVEDPAGTYRTNVNGDYGDVTGVEISLRKQASMQPWGAIWGYANFTTQSSIYGRSGDPYSIKADGSPGYLGGSGDYIVHNNPRLKAGIYYQTPRDWAFLAGILSRVSVSLDYLGVIPNEMILSDYYYYKGTKYLRSWDQNTNLRLRKDISLASNALNLGIYLEVRNLFNDKWLNLGVFEGNITPEDEQKMVESDFKYLPSYDKDMNPILELSKYRNLPRSFVIGVALEM